MDAGKIHKAAGPRTPIMMVGWKKEEDKLSIRDGVTNVDYPGLTRDVTVRYDMDKIRIEKRDSTPNVTISLKGNNIEVHRDGANKDVRILRDVDAINVEKSSHDDDVTITRRGNIITIDRVGMENDAKVSSAADNPLPYPLYITWDGEVIEQV